MSPAAHRKGRPLSHGKDPRLCPKAGQDMELRSQSIVYLAQATCVPKAAAQHMEWEDMMKILMVLTSHDILGESGKKTGFWLEEFAAPYYVFKDAGAEITLASPKGGRPPIDPASDTEGAQTEDTHRFGSDEAAQAKLANTAILSSVTADDFDAVFFPGGHGPLWDLSEDPDSIALIEAFAAQGRPIGAVCHAPAVFKHPKAGDGQPFVAGRKVTGFTNTEEDGVGLTDIVPFLLEDMLKSNGAQYHKGDDWAPFVVVDGLLVTGQNPASSEQSAQNLLALVEARGAAA